MKANGLLRIIKTIILFALVSIVHNGTVFGQSLLRAEIRFDHPSISLKDYKSDTVAIKIINKYSKKAALFKQLYVGYDGDAYTDVYFRVYKQLSDGALTEVRLRQEHFFYSPETDDNSSIELSRDESHVWRVTISDMYPLVEKGKYYFQAFFIDKYAMVAPSDIAILEVR